eukprot:CAMPEP_0174732820 /NCGR_PEP_ID=MMETSP1094-20130205/60085_1 /TAXON_ID=156173 /ORGANISM="Chrysochromulina brevifilum, Strain UTEX LB 985" /LENGTH=31 /DNA_ID= /DNA_START= /DNA_END= /DNA_ORIENTATION=
MKEREQLGACGSLAACACVDVIGGQSLVQRR